MFSTWSHDTPSHLDQSRYDHLHRLVDDSEAVGVVQAHDVGAHEGEDGHDVVQDFFLEEDEETRYTNWVLQVPLLLSVSSVRLKFVI